jgi:hypothetical protein
MNRTTKFSIRNLTDASAAGKFVFIPSFQAGCPTDARRADRGVPGHGELQHRERARHRLREHGALLPDRRPTGHQVLVDPYTSKPYVVFYTTARVGGDVVDFEAMKFLKFA